MGLAASQGRYLCLTARMSDLVFEGQQISSQRLILATESKEAAEKYNKAMSNSVMEAQIYDENGNPASVRLTYDVLTNKDLTKGLGMRIVDANGHIVVPENATEELKASLKNGDNDETFVYDEGVSDADYIQEMITSGQWFLQSNSGTDEKSEWTQLESWQGSSQISLRNYTEDDAAAEAEYEEATKNLEKKDKMFEMRLEQIQTEENAVETEIDSVKQVISENIENSFKTFA